MKIIELSFNSYLTVVIIPSKHVRDNVTRFREIVSTTLKTALLVSNINRAMEKSINFLKIYSDA